MPRNYGRKITHNEARVRIEASLLIAAEVLGVGVEAATLRCKNAVDLCRRDLLWYIVLTRDPKIPTTDIAEYCGFFWNVGAAAMKRVKERVDSEIVLRYVLAHQYIATFGVDKFRAQRDFVRDNSTAYEAYRTAGSKSKRNRFSAEGKS